MGDGDDDIILGPANGLASDVLLLNNGSGVFEEQENAFPARYLDTEAQTVNIIAADFNNDGFPDILSTTVDGRDATFF